MTIDTSAGDPKHRFDFEISHKTKATRRLDVRVGVGFTLMLLLMLSLVLVGLARMAAINQHLEDIVARNMAKGNLAWRMNLALRERLVSMHAMTIMTDPFDQLDELDRMRNHGAQFLAGRKQLETLVLSAEERTLLAHIRAQATKTRPLTEHVVEQVLAGQYQDARTSIRTRAMPQQAAIIQYLNQFIELQQNQMQQVIAQAAQSYIKARRLMLLLGGLAVGLGALIGVVVIRYTAQQARALQRQALYDGLTDLPNRILFDDRLRQAILIGQREKRGFGLMVMDIDRFKQINDTFGHPIGDLVLQHVARCTHACLRESDTLARMGGDEFTLLLATAGNAEDVIAVAKKVLLALRTPCLFEEQNLTIGASLGIALFPQQGENADRLMRAADAAMYAAKHAHSGYRLYSESLNHPLGDSLAETHVKPGDCQADVK